MSYVVVIVVCLLFFLFELHVIIHLYGAACHIIYPSGVCILYDMYAFTHGSDFLFFRVTMFSMNKYLKDHLSPI